MKKGNAQPRRSVPTLLGGLLCAAAVAVAVDSERPPVPPPLTEALEREAWVFVASEEQTMRDAAKIDFPGDAWSQDDHFFGSVAHKVHEFAGSHNASRWSVWRAVDRGMREKWPLPVGKTVRATVVPCRPRPIY